MSFSIRVRDLRKSYGGNLLARILGFADAPKKALDGISLDVQERERVGIVGANGAGKSTLLHILAGTASASSGDVEISGRVHAVLTLGLGLRDDLSGRENLKLDADISAPNAPEPAIAAMAAFADLGPFLDQPVRTYSSGMKARLAFASLIHVQPEILLLDETLSVGDHAFATKAKSALRRLCDQGRIVVIVSHELATLAELCTRILWLDQGKLVADGPPETVLPAYAEAARARDAQALATRFAKREPVWSADERTATISSLAFRGPAGEGLGEVGAAAELQLDLRLAGPAELALELSIERLDGLAQHRRRDALGALPAGESRFAATISPLPFAPGYYRAEAALLSGDSALSRRSAMFEIRGGTEHRGGSPALEAEIRVETAP